MLHETASLYPDDATVIGARLKDCFAALLHDDALDKLAPLDMVALVEENADLLPDGAAGEALEERLADRLVALDLPQRASAVLEKLRRAAPSAAGKAGFGSRLAALRLREDNPTGALAALAASDAPDLSPPLTEARTLLAKFRLRGDSALRPCSALSPGERTRAGLALLMARGVNFLVLDEPTNHLDIEAIEQLEQALSGYPRTLLLVTHDRRLADAVQTDQTIDIRDVHASSGR